MSRRKGVHFSALVVVIFHPSLFLLRNVSSVGKKRSSKNYYMRTISIKIFKKICALKNDTRL